MVDFEAICEVSNASSAFVCMRDDNHLVPAVDELRGELVDVAFDSAWLGKEPVADHCNVVRHGGGEEPLCQPVFGWSSSISSDGSSLWQSRR